MHDGINRPSTLVFALATAASVVCVMLLADLGHWRSAELYALAGVLAFAAIAGLWHGGLAVLGFVLLVVDARRERQPEPVVYAPPDDDEPAEPPEADVSVARKVATSRVFTAGAVLGFSQPKLAGIISSDPWQVWTDFYTANPDGDPVLDRVRGNVGTMWRRTWNLDRVNAALLADVLPLPPGPPPTVRPFALESRARHSAESKSAAVVEGVVVASEKG